MYNCVQKQTKFPLLLLLILLTQEMYYNENKFLFAETLKYCGSFLQRRTTHREKRWWRERCAEGVHGNTISPLQHCYSADYITVNT